VSVISLTLIPSGTGRSDEPLPGRAPQHKRAAVNMTVLAAERKGQGTEMSGRGAQQHRAAAQAVEHPDEMLGRNRADAHDLMCAQNRDLMRQ
jgi:hypothetical protein